MLATMHMIRFMVVLLTLCAVSGFSLATEKYLPWKMENYAINAPLGDLKGNAKRGRQIVMNRKKGNCLACHSFPIAEESFHGQLGPALNAIASRMTEGQIRLRVVDETKINPMTVMPGYYKNPKEHNRVADDFYGKTVLTAQEVEDVVAYLVTLK